MGCCSDAPTLSYAGEGSRRTLIGELVPIGIGLRRLHEQGDRLRHDHTLEERNDGRHEIYLIGL